MDCIIIFISTINLRKAKLALFWLITESILAEIGTTKVEDQNCANYPFEDQNWVINPLSTNFTKWSNTLKQFVGKLATNRLSVFDHFVRLALKGLTSAWK